MIAAILKYWQVGAGAVLGALLAAGPVYLYGSSQGRQAVAIERLQSDIKAERERIDSDAKVQALSDYDFCVQSLRSRKLPVDACEPLRGL
jgi:hypothetical protein